MEPAIILSQLWSLIIMGRVNITKELYIGCLIYRYGPAVIKRAFPGRSGKTLKWLRFIITMAQKTSRKEGTKPNRNQLSG
jgi:hypothetical protein